MQPTQFLQSFGVVICCLTRVEGLRQNSIEMSWSARVKFIWQERASEFEPLSLPQRYHHTSVLYKDPNLLDIKLIICGGHARNGSFFSDVWVFSKAQKSWFQFKPETPLFLEKTASVVVNNFLYLLGGVNESKEYVSLNTIPVLDCQQIEKGWEKVVAKGSCPNSCVGHTASLVNKRIYVMGGTDTETFETLWALDTGDFCRLSTLPLQKEQDQKMRDCVVIVIFFF